MILSFPVYFYVFSKTYQIQGISRIPGFLETLFSVYFKKHGRNSENLQEIKKGVLFR